MRHQFCIVSVIFLLLCLVHFVMPFAGSMTIPLAFLTFFALLMRKWWLMFALLFSFLGDVMGYMHQFIPQMACFAITQILYIKLFRPLNVKGTAMYVVIAGVSMLWLSVMGLLAMNMTDMWLLLPMGIYAALLLTMFTHASLQGSWLLAVAALLFVVSDSMIAINKFVVHIPHAHYYIMVTYWMAQWGIVYKKRVDF